MSDWMVTLATGRGFWMPEQASTVAEGVDNVFNFITWISIFFFVLIVGLMGYFMYRYRRTSHVSNPVGPTHHTALEVTWTVLPLILVIAIFYVGMKGYLKLQQAPAGAYEVEATGQKWFWTFLHPDYGVQETDLLAVPAGRPVKVVLQSADVLHALFIPAFRVKEDVVPGRVRDLWFEAPDTSDEIRVYDLFCAEYCGTEHSQMIAKVEVVPKLQWEDYITKKIIGEDDINADNEACYAATYLFPRCSSCHSLDGTDKTGPSFKGLWERVTEQQDTVAFTDGTNLKSLIEGGVYANAEDYVATSILQPQKHIRQTFSGAMPTFQGQLQPWQVRALRRFLADPYQVIDEAGNVTCTFEKATGASE